MKCELVHLLQHRQALQIMHISYWDRNPCLGQTSLLKPSFIANSTSHLLPTEVPEAVGSCDEENLYLTLPTFGLHQYWDLYLGNKILNRHVALTNGYLAATNSTHLILQIPLFAGGLIYEVQELLSNVPLKAHRAVGSHRVLHSQSVVLWHCTYWKTSRGKDSEPEQVG